MRFTFYLFHFFSVVDETSSELGSTGSPRENPCGNLIEWWRFHLCFTNF